MGKAYRDGNQVHTVLGVLDSDGITPIALVATASNHATMVNFGTTGSDNGDTKAVRDENFVTAIMGVSEVDGVTPVPIYFTSGGALKIDNT